MTIHLTEDGGIELVIRDEEGIERAVKFVPNDDGTIDIQGRGPNGKSERATIAPGQGDTPLGK